MAARAEGGVSAEPGGGVGGAAGAEAVVVALGVEVDDLLGALAADDEVLREAWNVRIVHILGFIATYFGDSDNIVVICSWVSTSAFASPSISNMTMRTRHMGM